MGAVHRASPGPVGFVGDAQGLRHRSTYLVRPACLPSTAAPPALAGQRGGGRGGGRQGHTGRREACGAGGGHHPAPQRCAPTPCLALVLHAAGLQTCHVQHAPSFTQAHLPRASCHLHPDPPTHHPHVQATWPCSTWASCSPPSPARCPPPARAAHTRAARSR